MHLYQTFDNRVRLLLVSKAVAAALFLSFRTLHYEPHKFLSLGIKLKINKSVNTCLQMCITQEDKTRKSGLAVKCARGKTHDFLLLQCKHCLLQECWFPEMATCIYYMHNFVQESCSSQWLIQSVFTLQGIRLAALCLSLCIHIHDELRWLPH